MFLLKKQSIIFLVTITEDKKGQGHIKMDYSFHDLKPGPISQCQICGSRHLELAIDLGHQPLCDSLLSEDDLNKAEHYYPLRQVWCSECSLNQIDFCVDGSEVYHLEYPYRSGITKELALYQHQFSSEIIQKFSISKNSFVIDIGSNDGTLLKGFKENGMRVLGVEPTNVAQIAQSENGIETLQNFFGEKIAVDIAKSHGKAQVITATNVFAHMGNLGDVMRGVSQLIDPEGIFVIENHYLAQVINKIQFDTIYHEHLRTYSLKSLIKLFSMYGFTVIHAQQVDRYGGNIRVVATLSKKARIQESVAEVLKFEETLNLTKKETYDVFRRKSYQIRDGLFKAAYEAGQAGRSFVGNSCPGRCSTLLNFAGITKDLMPYIAEQPTSLKLGKYLPGKHIPVVNNQRLIEEQPDEVVILAWHYAEPIMDQLRKRGLKSKFVVPFPEVHFIKP